MAKSFGTPKPEDIHATNITELKSRIKSKKLSGSYVFYGEEEYTKKHYYDEFVSACTDKNMNIKTIYESDFSLPAFINACDTTPANAFDMFSSSEDENDAENSYRIIRLINPSFDSLSSKDEKLFLSKIADPDDGVIIVFYLYENQTDLLSKRIYKEITESALTVCFKHEPLGSPSLVSWTLRHFTKAGIEADRQVASYLCNCVGNDLTTLKNEIDNCISYLKFENRTLPTIKDIDTVCKKSSFAKVFEISSAALVGNYPAAIAAFKVFEDANEEAVNLFARISSSVYELCRVEKLLAKGESAADISGKTGILNFIVKNHIAALNKRSREMGNNHYANYASELCIKYDSLIKSSYTDGYELLKELIFKLSFPEQ